MSKKYKQQLKVKCDFVPEEARNRRGGPLEIPHPRPWTL
jgi:hypothetical protein